MKEKNLLRPLSVWLFLATFCLIFYGMGASFVESFVNYPTWPLIGANGLSIPAIERLIFTNLWFRKVPQVITSALFVWMMYTVLRERVGTPSSESLS